MKNKTLAAIDIGTNTFRLLIAKINFNPEINNYSIKEIHSERIITRLGEGIPENRLLKKEAVDRSIPALIKFSDIISQHNVYKTSAVATSALREAENGNEFLEKAKEATGFDIKIITGEEEAKVTASGMLIDIAQPNSALMVDIGGGSTEIIYAIHGESSLVHSLNLGVVYLADKYMKNDPPSNDDLNQMSEEISQKIMLSANSFAKPFTNDTVFIGTAGTITTLAAITQHLTKFEHDKIHKFKLTIDTVRSIFYTLSKITSEKRAQYIPFEPARLDIIVPGTLILLKLMEVFNLKEITVSNYGLREGILLDICKSVESSQ